MTAERGVITRRATERELADWDGLVQRFRGSRITHTRGWMDSLEASGCGRPLYLVFEREGETVGCLPGLVSTVGPLRLFGSPRAGWQTVSLGPVFDPERLTTHDLVSSLLTFLESCGIAHVELMEHSLAPDTMRELGFEGEPVPTYVAPLHPGDERRTLRGLKESARRNIQRAERLGLEVRFERDDRFVDEHYDQLREVYLRGGHLIPFSRQRVLQCFRHMRDAGRLIAASVHLPGGAVCIATGMFLVHDEELLLWMWAHREHYRWYRPTELMTWTVMRHAMARGCTTFDLMGRGDFKLKFGAEADLSKWRWMRSRPAWLHHARRVAETGFRWQQSVRGRARRLVSRVSGERAGRRGGVDRRPAACVIGDADLVRALGLGGVRSVVVAPPRAPARYSRFTAATLPWCDPWERPEALVETLLAHAARQPEPPVLFYQEDRSLLLVSRYRERLRTLFRFVIPESALVEALVDKGRFQELARTLGLPVPPARRAAPPDDPPPDEDTLTFPVIVKPLTRRPQQWRKFAADGKALRVDTPDALRALWPALAADRLRVVVQSMIPGPEARIESYHVYVDARGVVAAEFTGRKIRTFPVAYGDSSALEITEASDVVVLGRDIVKRLGLRGVAKLDFKRDDHGALHLLEVNPRFTLWHHLGAVAGVNVPALVYADLMGWPRAEIPAARAGVRWCKPWTDARAASALGVPLREWIPWAIGAEAKSAFAWDDPRPLVEGAARRWASARRTPVALPDEAARVELAVETRGRPA
jgi:predicted ATP-grasp superfamily ATP-dependent carboligase